MSRGKGKVDIALTGKRIRKERQVMFRLPKDKMDELKKLINKYELSSMQELFDYLIVSGIVFRKPEILDFIRKYKKKYKKRSRQERLSRLKKAKRPNMPKTTDLYSRNVHMYHEDYKAFKDYIIEENIAQQWVFNILFIDGFLKEEPAIINLITRARDLEINKRKKAVARLSNDEFVSALSEYDANLIMEKLTEEYDKKEFDPEIQEFISNVLNNKIKEETNDNELNTRLEAKLTRLRQSRARSINIITAPREID